MAGLLDPCEKENVDAVGNLSLQQREDLTFAAQVSYTSQLVEHCHTLCPLYAITATLRGMLLDGEPG